MPCNSIQVGTQISLEIDGVPDAITNSFGLTSGLALLNKEVVSVPATSQMAVPLGGITLAEEQLIFIANLDPALPLFVSQNSNGSAPFAEIKAGCHLLLPAVPGQAYYLSNTNGSAIAALVLVLSS